jgi:hypothetical protein
LVSPSSVVVVVVVAADYDIGFLTVVLLGVVKEASPFL